MATDFPIDGEEADADARARIRRPIAHLGLFLGLVILWEVTARIGWLNPLILPAPTRILNSFWLIAVANGNLWGNLWITMWEVLVGFAVGSVVGIVLAVIIGMSPLMMRFLKPYVIIIETTPRIALAPLIIAALGFGWTSKITIITLVCFFAPFMNTLAGILSTDSEKTDMFRSLGATRLQTFNRLIMPEASPMIMAGLRLAMAAALSGALVAEFISANSGMGVMLRSYANALNMASAFATLLTLTFVGFVLFRGMEALERVLVFWKTPERMERVSARRRVRFLRNAGRAT